MWFSPYALLLVAMVMVLGCECKDNDRQNEVNAETTNDDVPLTEQVHVMRKSAKSGYHGDHHHGGGHHGYSWHGGHGKGHHGYGKKYHYNPCGSIFEKTGFCFHKYAGHYAHHNPKCYVQCDAWGRGYIRPCAKGTYWIGGKGPTKYNKCVGRYQKHGHHGNKFNHGGHYGGPYGYGGGYGGTFYGFKGF